MPAAAALPTIALLAGCAFGLLLPLPIAIVFAVFFPVLALTASFALWAWTTSRPLMLVPAVAAAFFAGGAILAASAWERAWRPSLRTAFESLAADEREQARLAGRTPPEDDSAFAVITGILRSDAALRPHGTSLSLEAVSISRPLSGGEMPVRGGVLLTVSGSLSGSRAGEWRSGRRLRVPAMLRRPSRYFNPGGRDDERALARRGTALVGSVKSAALVEVIERAWWPAETAAAARGAARRAIASAVERWSPRSAGIVTAIIVGDRAGLDADVQERLQEAGTYHVIAISGGNIAIFAALALVGFRLAGVLGRVAMMSAATALLAYGYFVDGGASVSRATLMAVVYFAARTIDLRGPPLNVLALAAGLLTAADPLAISDPGFLLTFSATTAIVIAVPVAPLERLPRVAKPIAAMLAASAAAEMVLLPLSATIFSRVTVAGLLLNFAAIPLMGIVQVAGLAVVLLAPVSVTLASIAGWVAHLAAEGLVRSADLLTIAPALAWRVAPPNPAIVAGYYIGLIAAWTLWRWRVRSLGSAEHLAIAALRRTAVVVALAAGLWSAAEPWKWFPPSSAGRLQVTFLDVGQGDAAVIRFPRGQTMLVDAGGLPGASSFDSGDRVVAPVLRVLGVGRLAWLAVTHGDVDHAGGAAAIVREFRPRTVWEGVPVPRLALLKALRAEASAAGAAWTTVQTGDRVNVDGVEIVVRHPRPPEWERQDVRNDDSIVLELLWGDVSIVLTGDIGREVEYDIASAFAPSPVRVVKIPHHGSLTSSSREFVQALRPRVAVVSAGRSNTFGHPAPAVLDTYRQAGAHVFRTDQDGAVTVATDGVSLEVGTFTGQRVFVKALGPRKHESTK